MPGIFHELELYMQMLLYLERVLCIAIQAIQNGKQAKQNLKNAPCHTSLLSWLYLTGVASMRDAYIIALPVSMKSGPDHI